MYVPVDLHATCAALPRIGHEIGQLPGILALVDLSGGVGLGQSTNDEGRLRGADLLEDDWVFNLVVLSEQ